MLIKYRMLTGLLKLYTLSYDVNKKGQYFWSISSGVWQLPRGVRGRVAISLKQHLTPVDGNSNNVTDGKSSQQNTSHLQRLLLFSKDPSYTEQTCTLHIRSNCTRHHAGGQGQGLRHSVMQQGLGLRQHSFPPSPPLSYFSSLSSSNQTHHLLWQVFSFTFSLLSALLQGSALEADSLISVLILHFCIHHSAPRAAAADTIATTANSVLLSGQRG